VAQDVGKDPAVPERFHLFGRVYTCDRLEAAGDELQRQHAHADEVRLRWMRSKLSAMTARTPSSMVPLAAQSRDDPEPYSLPAITTSGTPACLYFIAAS
jgi:hypothetical protein